MTRNMYFSVLVLFRVFRGANFLGGYMLYAEEIYAILGGCYEVYKRMVCGFLEAVYQECLEIEFEHRGVPFVAQPELKLTYRGWEL